MVDFTKQQDPMFKKNAELMQELWDFMVKTDVADRAFIMEKVVNISEEAYTSIYSRFRTTIAEIRADLVKSSITINEVFKLLESI